VTTDPKARQGRRLSLRSGLIASALTWALAVGGATAIAAAVLQRPDPPPQPDALNAPQWMPPDAAPAGQAAAAADASDISTPAPAPLRVRIPRIGVDAPVDTLDLNPDHTIGVPAVPTDAGWYKWSAQPGDLGPAVILGHVDAPGVGAAVFYRLGSLHYGDHIKVERADGVVDTFLVTAVAEFDKATFPTDAVYGPTTQPALRLITCGDWDAASHSYRGNTVVFADLESTTASPTSSATPTPERSDVDAQDPDSAGAAA
jgi:sortase (surface protein transpeptidase)